jgi:hypothetical protein
VLVRGVYEKSRGDHLALRLRIQPGPSADVRLTKAVQPEGGGGRQMRRLALACLALAGCGAESHSQSYYDGFE